jgi:hypothetical protein
MFQWHLVFRKPANNKSIQTQREFEEPNNLVKKLNHNLHGAVKLKTEKSKQEPKLRKMKLI